MFHALGLKPVADAGAEDEGVPLEEGDVGDGFRVCREAEQIGIFQTQRFGAGNGLGNRKRRIYGFSHTSFFYSTRKSNDPSGAFNRSSNSDGNAAMRRAISSLLQG